MFPVCKETQLNLGNSFYFIYFFNQTSQGTLENSSFFRRFSLKADVKNLFSRLAISNNPNGHICSDNNMAALPKTPLTMAADKYSPINTRAYARNAMGGHLKTAGFVFFKVALNRVMLK